MSYCCGRVCICDISGRVSAVCRDHTVRHSRLLESSHCPQKWLYLNPLAYLLSNPLQCLYYLNILYMLPSETTIATCCVSHQYMDSAFLNVFTSVNFVSPCILFVLPSSSINPSYNESLNWVKVKSSTF